jgi:hypothetical protein
MRCLPPRVCQTPQSPNPSTSLQSTQGGVLDAKAEKSSRMRTLADEDAAWHVDHMVTHTATPDTLPCLNAKGLKLTVVVPDNVGINHFSRLSEFVLQVLPRGLPVEVRHKAPPPCIRKKVRTRLRTDAAFWGGHACLVGAQSTAASTERNP